MYQTLLHTLTLITALLLIWGGYVAYRTQRIINFAKRRNTGVRREDRLIFVGSLGIMLTTFFVLFIYPALIFQVPSASIAIEVGVAVLLFHMTEIQQKNWSRIVKIPVP